MYAFLSDRKPRSIQAKNKRHSEIYRENIRSAFREYHVNVELLNGNLYGAVYYFHSIPTQLDADNLSKPIWDALKDVVYPDDNAIKLRTVGILDLGSGAPDILNVLDLSLMPDSLMTDFLEMIDNKEHILYIEVGELNYGLFRFGCEGVSEV